ncbi:HAD family hydrolase [Treponema sp.]
MKNCVVFDLDGTLVNTIDDIASSVNKALALHNLPLPAPHAYPKMVGWGLRRLVEQTLASPTDDLIDAICADSLLFYQEEPASRSFAYPGIKAVLQTLLEKDIKTAVLTNKPDSVACLVIAKIFPQHPFLSVRGDRAGAAKKPDKALSLELLAEIGCSPEETLFVGDSGVDVETAHNVGCPVIGVSWGFRPRLELEEAGADRIVDTAQALQEAIIALASR